METASDSMTAGHRAMGPRSPSSWEQRQEERRVRKQNKKKKNEQVLALGAQNFNGIMGEHQLEEACLAMKLRGVGVLCCQEGWRPKRSVTRRGAGELMVAFEDDDSCVSTSTKKDGNCFVVTAKWKAAFLRGGKQVKRFCPRLVTMRVPLGNGKDLYLINVHWPDDSRPRAVRGTSQQRLEGVIGEATHIDALVLGGGLECVHGHER